MTASRAEIGKRRKAQMRAALVNAAMSVFARLGPDAPSVEDFIAEAGVARGTFYNYFQTREDVLIAVASEVSDQLLEQMRPLRGLPDPADRVGCSVRTFIRMAASDPARGWLVVRTALVAAPLGASMRRYLTSDIADGIRTRRFHVPSAQVAADLILGAGLMGMRTVLRGQAGRRHGEDVAQMILSAFEVQDAAEVARRSMLPGALAARAESIQARVRPRLRK